MATTSSSRVLAVIPARYASSRFRGKIIADLCGKPLVLHAYERAKEAKRVDEVLIAADDPLIIEALKPFDARVVMTRVDHPSGTDRIAEAVASLDADIVVNVQGDEPVISPVLIDQAVEVLQRDPEVMMSTARSLIHDPELITNPNCVKLICDRRGRALYFSRSPIPYIRDAKDQDAAATCYWQHIGLYVYRKDFLLKYAAMPMTPLERLEKLEQLRALENGYPIAVVDTEYESIGVDTPEDLEAVRRLLGA